MIVHVVPDTRVANPSAGVVGVGRDDEPTLEDVGISFEAFAFGGGNPGWGCRSSCRTLASGGRHRRQRLGRDRHELAAHLTNGPTMYFIHGSDFV